MKGRRRNLLTIPDEKTTPSVKNEGKLRAEYSKMLLRFLNDLKYILYFIKTIEEEMQKSSIYLINEN